MDFGPLNLSIMKRYAQILDNLFREDEAKTGGRTIFVHQTMKGDEERVVNSALLVSSFAVIRQNYTARDAFRNFIATNRCEDFICFRDATACPSCTTQLFILKTVYV
jgi:hypothetical protein